MRIQLWSQKPLWWRMDTSEVKTLPNFKGSGRKILPLGWRPFPKHVRSLWIRMNCWKEKNILKKCCFPVPSVMFRSAQTSMCVHVLSHSVVSDSLRPHGQEPAMLFRPWRGLACPSPGDLPNPGTNSGLQHCRWILYHLSHQGSTRILEWVAYPFSRGTSHPRNWTRASCIAGEGNGNRLQYACLENPIDGGAW